MENPIIIEKIFKSEKKSISIVEPLVFDLKDQLGIEIETFYNVMIAVTEAVNNAIIHGNKCDPEKDVYLKIEASKEKFVIVVRDHGRGFNPDKVADPRKPENLLKEGGRGVFLIKELANDVKFKIDDKGTEMTMWFNFDK
jgi:anti-sigma regulatory factor (Ser/Thr protein kinase)